ncbi:MAG: hypothetical protein CM15mP10_2700 [Actinomycetota bacterium]|nr:MAG: hypothetical protein CM15mP10_2700 [Actinomycetota bacterium]
MKKSLILLTILLVTCGGSQENISDVAYQEPFISDSIQEMSTSRSMELSTGDYIIKTAYGTMEVSSSNFQNTINEFETLILNYEGSISNTYLSTNYQGLQSYTLTVNIPAEQFDKFISDLEDISEFKNISINANDVTTYVLNIDSRLKALINEKQELEKIKSDALNTSEKLEVQSQLRYINQEIEILKDQKEFYETSVNYSTLSLEIREGAGISLFSWNYYVERALNWLESLIGYLVSISIVGIPIVIFIYSVRKFSNKRNNIKT